MGVRWVSDGCQMGVRWVSDGCQMGIAYVFNTWHAIYVAYATTCFIRAPRTVLAKSGAWILQLQAEIVTKYRHNCTKYGQVRGVDIALVEAQAVKVAILF
jgi:hypothetical protein